MRKSRKEQILLDAAHKQSLKSYSRNSRDSTKDTYTLIISCDYMDNAWAWLTANSGTIQGLTSIVNIIVTMVLGLVTVWCAWMTSKMLEATRMQAQTGVTAQQLDLLRNSRRAAMYIARFHKLIDELPWGDADLSNFISAHLWTDSDVESFQSAITTARPDSAVQAGKLVDTLRRLTTLQVRLKSPSGTQAQIDGDHYRSLILAARNHINSVTASVVSES